MNPLKQITSADAQRYARIVLYLVSGALLNHGISIDPSWASLIEGLVLGGANLGWSVYGMRINAKIAEISKYAEDPNNPIRGLIVENTKEGRELAATISGPVVAAGTSSAEAIARTV